MKLLICVAIIMSIEKPKMRFLLNKNVQYIFYYSITNDSDKCQMTVINDSDSWFF